MAIIEKYCQKLKSDADAATELLNLSPTSVSSEATSAESEIEATGAAVKRTETRV